jgi:hypothetical protein
MGRRRKEPPMPLVIVHDHMDGSAHCVECGGTCVLTGADLLVTRMVRFLLAQESISPKWFIPPMIESSLREQIGESRLAELRARERQTTPDYLRAKRNTSVAGGGK